MLPNTDDEGTTDYEPVGRVRSIRGSEVWIGLFGGTRPTPTTVTVGQFFGICRGQSLVVGMISEVSTFRPRPGRTAIAQSPASP
jgi:hypothetical protein